MRSTASWSWDAQSLSELPDPERRWGYCARISGPCNSAIIRLVGAVLLELNDERQLQHRYMQTGVMAELTPALVEAFPPQIATAAE